MRGFYTVLRISQGEVLLERGRLKRVQALALFLRAIHVFGWLK